MLRAASRSALGALACLARPAFALAERSRRCELLLRLLLLLLLLLPPQVRAARPACLFGQPPRRTRVTGPFRRMGAPIAGYTAQLNATATAARNAMPFFQSTSCNNFRSTSCNNFLYTAPTASWPPRLCTSISHRCPGRAMPLPPPSPEPDKPFPPQAIPSPHFLTRSSSPPSSSPWPSQCACCVPASEASAQSPRPSPSSSNHFIHPRGVGGGASKTPDKETDGKKKKKNLPWWRSAGS